MNRVCSSFVVVVTVALSGCGHDSGGGESTEKEPAALAPALTGAAGGGEPAGSGVTPGPSTKEQAAETPSTDPPEPADGAPSVGGEPFTYFTARRDERKCASPYCGGFWVHAVNTDATSCADGTRAPECYVADLDLSALKLDDETRRALLDRESVFRGNITRLVFSDTSAPSVGRFSATEAWLSRAPSLTASIARGSYYRVRTNAILCITVPCASLTESLLNSTKNENIHALDLTYAPGTEKDKAAAQAETNEPQGLLALGTNVASASTDSRSDTIALRASQYFLRVGVSTPTTR